MPGEMESPLQGSRSQALQTVTLYTSLPLAQTNCLLQPQVTEHWGVGPGDSRVPQPLILRMSLRSFILPQAVTGLNWRAAPPVGRRHPREVQVLSLLDPLRKSLHQPQPVLPQPSHKPYFPPLLPHTVPTEQTLPCGPWCPAALPKVEKALGERRSEAGALQWRFEKWK